MSEMMKCFVMHGIGKVGVMDKPVSRPGPSDAIIRTFILGGIAGVSIAGFYNLGVRKSG